MKINSRILTPTLLLNCFCLVGCKVALRRPALVPATAVWIDNVFVDCSVEAQSKANRCTVYKDHTGEILTDGLFVLNTSGSAASLSDLHYAAFANQTVYLEDARMLVLYAASERDPSSRIVDDRLRGLSQRGSAEPTNCNDIASKRGSGAASDCAIKLFAETTPFYVRFYRQGIDSFYWQGFAGDESGNVYELDFASTGWMSAGSSQGTQLLDNNRTFVMPCPKPTMLQKAEQGTLTCSRSKSESQPSHATRHSSISQSP